MSMVSLHLTDVIEIQPAEFLREHQLWFIFIWYVKVKKMIIMFFFHLMIKRPFQLEGMREKERDCPFTDELQWLQLG